MRVLFQPAYIVAGAPVLLFHYGILELGSPDREPSEGCNLEAFVRNQLMEKGMRSLRPGELPPLLHIAALVIGNTLHVWWHDKGPDEMEVSEVWLKHVHTWGGFVALYLNFCPFDEQIDVLHSMGALTGVVPVREWA